MESNPFQIYLQNIAKEVQRERKTIFANKNKAAQNKKMQKKR